MLSFFRRNHLFTSLLLFPFTLFMRHVGWVFPLPRAEQAGGSLYYPVADLDWDLWYWQLGVSFLIFVHAIILNRLCVINRLGTEISLIPGLIYISLASFLPSFLFLSPPVLAVTFLLIAVTQVFYTYKRFEVSSRIFNTGFWLGIAALCYPGMVLYFLFGYIGLIILRSFKWKEQLRYITGFVLPFFLTLVGYFWFDATTLFFELQFSSGLEMFFFEPAYRTPILVVGIAMLAMCVLVLNYNFYTKKKNIKSRKKIDILYWSLFFGGLTVIFQNTAGLTHLMLLLPAMSYFISEHLIQTRSHSLAEFLHLMLILAVFFSQYSLFLL